MTDNLLYVGAGFVSALAFVWIFFLANCSTGSVRVVRNPHNDPDNPNLLYFEADPDKWLKKKYVILTVRK